MAIKTFLVIISCYLTHTTAKCPSAEVIFPCICEYEVNIVCGGNQYYDIRNIFVSLSGVLKQDEKQFYQFYFNNTAIDELPTNVFYDITFESILIHSAYNLSLINTNAFQSTNTFVKSFYAYHIPYGNVTDNNNIFIAINGMINVEVIYIINTSIPAIPANAFAALNQLAILVIDENRNVNSIGDNAFYELNNLEVLRICYNPIDHISDHALSFRNRNPNTIVILMSYMPNLTSNSFSIHAFSTIKRPFFLYLSYDHGLKYLDVNVFGSVLGDSNQLDLAGTRLECDCKMYWLYENRTQYQNLVHSAICTDSKSVFVDRAAYADCNAH